VNLFGAVSPVNKKISDVRQRFVTIWFMKVAEAVRSWRLLEKLTVRDAAERIGIDRSVLHRLESGHPVSASNLAAVVRWLLSE
jgi:predicted DNA-binding protein (UPF0251 family)